MTRRRGLRFWGTAAAGWALMLWGWRGVLDHHVDTRPAELGRFVLGGTLVHDVIVVPVVLLVGLGLRRVVPARWRSPVQFGAVVSACVALFAYPLVRGFGHVHDNPTSLPHDYTVNLVVVVGVVWATVVVAVTALHRRRRPDGTTLRFAPEQHEAGHGPSRDRRSRQPGAPRA